MQKIISEFRNEYYFLSNFYSAPVTYNGVSYKNNEAAFQAQKCISTQEQLQFSKLNPSEAKKLGRHVNLRKDWEQVKRGIMKYIVRAKFDQNPDLMKKLIETQDAILIEGNTWGDRIWGCVKGKDGEWVGKNMLGNILSEVREQYILESSASYKRETVANPFSEQYSANFKKHEPEIIRARQVNAEIKEILVD